MPAPVFFTSALAVSAIFSWCSSSASAARVKAIDEVELGVESSGQLAAGHLLRDRYELDSFVERRALGRSVQQATPGKSFPTIKRLELSDAEHLGRGSFGDTWSALDKRTGKKVAVKIFYKGRHYLNWRSAGAHADILREFASGQSECKLNKQILGSAAIDPIGASRICACHSEHISDAKGTELPVFLVQEMCGHSLEKSFIDRHKAKVGKRGTYDLERARDLTKQLLEGIRFMQKFTPSLIHHDLKPENVAINDAGEVKIIDWGAMIYGNQQSQFSPAVATPAYMPPETLSGLSSFMHPASSYDVYAAGLIYLELLCPSMNVKERALSRPLMSYKVTRLVERGCPGLSSAIPKDLELVNRMVHSLPQKRPKPEDVLGHPALQPPSILAPVAPGNGARAKGTLPPTAAPAPGAGVRVASPPAAAPAHIDEELSDEELKVDPLFVADVMDPEEVRAQQKAEGKQPLLEIANTRPEFPDRDDLSIVLPRAVKRVGNFVRMKSYISANAMEDWTWTFDKCYARCDMKDFECEVKQDEGALFGTINANVPEEAKQCYMYAHAMCKVAPKGLKDTNKKKEWTTEKVSYIKYFTVPKDLFE